MNPFESGARKVIPAVLVYVKSADDQVLMIHRMDGAGASSAADYHAGKWNGLGENLNWKSRRFKPLFGKSGKKQGLNWTLPGCACWELFSFRFQGAQERGLACVCADGSDFPSFRRGQDEKRLRRRATPLGAGEGHRVSQPLAGRSLLLALLARGASVFRDDLVSGAGSFQALDCVA